MISKSDILLLLTDLEDKGINISKYTVIIANRVDLRVKYS